MDRAAEVQEEILFRILRRNGLGSIRTVREPRSITAPAPTSASSARSPSTCIPISDRIRNDAVWIESTSSADRISMGRYGLTRRRHGTWRTPPAARRARRWIAAPSLELTLAMLRPALSNLRRVSASAAWMDTIGRVVCPGHVR